MATLSRQQVKDLIDKRPSSVTPEQVVNGLLERGHTLEGLQQTQTQPQERNYRLRDVPLEAIKNVPASAGRLVEGLATAATQPVQTAKTLAQIPIGLGNILGRKLAEATIPEERRREVPESESERLLKALTDSYRRRYSGPEATKRTVAEDPVGFLADAAGLLTGAGAVVSGSGKAAKASQLATAGSRISQAGRTIEPISLVTGAAGRGVERLTKGRKIAPFSSSVDTEAQALAKEYGIELPLSAQSQSPFVRQFEALAAKGIFGGKTAEKARRAIAELDEIVEETSKKLNSATDLKAVGEDIVRSFDKYKQNYIKTKNSLYDEAAIRTKIPVRAEDTIRFLDEVIANKKEAAKVVGQAKDLPYLLRLRKGLARKSLDARSVREALRELNNKIGDINDPVATADKATLQRAAASLSDDLDRTISQADPQLAAAIDEANQFYRQGLDKLNSDFGGKIKGLTDRPEQIVDAIIKPNSQSLVEELYTVVDQPTKQGIQGAFMKRLFEQSLVKNTNSVSGAKLKLNRMRLKEPTVRAVLDDTQYQALNNIQDQLTKLERLKTAVNRGQKIAEGSQTAFLQKTAGELLLSLSALFSLNPLAVKGAFIMLAGDKLANVMLQLPKVQQFFTEGIELTGKTGRAIQRGSQRVAPGFIVGEQAGRFIESQMPEE